MCAAHVWGARNRGDRSQRSFASPIRGRAHQHSAGSDNVRASAFREFGDVDRLLRVAAAPHQCGDCLVANRKALVCIRRSQSFQSVSAAVDTRRRRPDTGILANPLPLRIRKIPAPASTEMRAASAGRVDLFRRCGLSSPQPFRKFACPIGDNNVRTGAFERSDDLEDCGALIQ